MVLLLIGYRQSNILASAALPRLGQLFVASANAIMNYEKLCGNQLQQSSAARRNDTVFDSIISAFAVR